MTSRETTSFFGIRRPDGDPCTRFAECGDVGEPNQCNGDDRWHRHGMIHVVEGGLEWLCATHADVDAQMWAAKRR